MIVVLSGCGVMHRSASNEPERFRLVKLFPDDGAPSATFDDSIIASPVVYVAQGAQRIVVPVANGVIAVLDKDTGERIWQVNVPVPAGQDAQLIATPVVINDKLVVSYQCLDKGVRVSHRLAVLDLAKQDWDRQFPVLIFAAEQATADGKAVVKFNPPTAYSHAALKHIERTDSDWGFVYAAFGNAGDTQPFHGWVFEIDMAAWRQRGADSAIRNVLLTTPEAECPSKMEYGTQEMICGGGVWAPTGPLVDGSGDNVELFIPTGNGQVDPERGDYANALLRVKPGLRFDDGCDARLCANFDAIHPAPACLASCKHLFIPRLAAGNAPIKPPFHECDDKDFWECLAWMDYDLGANTPVKVELSKDRSVLVQAGKDGGVYLLDAEHLGRQYDRLQIAQLCGSPTDLCKLSWAGMIVTQPVQTRVAGEPVVIVPTFSADRSHAAGLVALKIVQHQGQPKLQPFWRFPGAGHAAALDMFRSHPSFPLLTTRLGRQQAAVVWIVDIGAPGTVYGIRAQDGVLVAQHKLQGSGRQLSMPLLLDDTLYLASKQLTTGKAMLEAYRIEPMTTAGDENR